MLRGRPRRPLCRNARPGRHAALPRARLRRLLVLERGPRRRGSPATELSDLRNAVCVVNSHESHSGANALRALVAPLNRRGRFFSRIVTSGSHPASVAMVARGEADVAAIDCVTYACLERYRPSRLQGTRRLCYTARAPGIPFVTRAGAIRIESGTCRARSWKPSRSRRSAPPAPRCSSTAWRSFRFRRTNGLSSSNASPPPRATPSYAERCGPFAPDRAEQCPRNLCSALDL